MIYISPVLTTTENSPALTDLPHSFAIDLAVTANNLDGFGHVNNAVYVQWLDQVHWAHLAHLGISWEAICEQSCGFVVHYTKLTYLAPLVENDLIRVGTAIHLFDGSFRMKRQFQIVRMDKVKTVLKGTIDYVSVNLKTGRPMRVPRDFAERISQWQDR